MSSGSETIDFGIRTGGTGASQDFAIRLNRNCTVRSKAIRKNSYAIHSKAGVEVSIGLKTQQDAHSKIVASRNSC
jgi:hypothetical protein